MVPELGAGCVGECGFVRSSRILIVLREYALGELCGRWGEEIEPDDVLFVSGVAL